MKLKKHWIVSGWCLNGWIVSGICILMASLFVGVIGAIYGMFGVVETAHMLLTCCAYVGWVAALFLMIGLMVWGDKDD